MEVIDFDINQIENITKKYAFVEINKNNKHPKYFDDEYFTLMHKHYYDETKNSSEYYKNKILIADFFGFWDFRKKLNELILKSNPEILDHDNHKYFDKDAQLKANEIKKKMVCSYRSLYYSIRLYPFRKNKWKNILNISTNKCFIESMRILFKNENQNIDSFEIHNSLVNQITSDQIGKLYGFNKIDKISKNYDFVFCENHKRV